MFRVEKMPESLDAAEAAPAVLATEAVGAGGSGEPLALDELTVVPATGKRGAWATDTMPACHKRVTTEDQRNRDTAVI